MIRSRTKRGALAAALLGLFLFAGELPARQRGGPPPEDQRPRMHDRGGQGPMQRALRELFFRVAQLPPEQQQRALEENALFQRLPPPVQQRVQEQLRRFNALQPEEQRRLLDRWERARRTRQAVHELFLRVAPLPPEEQAQALREDSLFQQLPPPLRERFRRRLEQFNRRPPEARRRMLQHFRRFRELSPEQQWRLQQRARQFARMSPQERQKARHIFRAWRELSPERRRLIVERLRRLHGTRPEERGQLMGDPDFLAPLAEDERRLLQGLWELRRHLPPAAGGRAVESLSDRNF